MNYHRSNYYYKTEWSMDLISEMRNLPLDIYDIEDNKSEFRETSWSMDD